MSWNVNEILNPSLRRFFIKIFGEADTISSSVTSGTTKSALKITPPVSVATTGVNYQKLVTIGDETGSTAYGFGDVTKPTTGLMASFGRTTVATSTQTDTGIDARVINKQINTAANVLQGMYVKAKNYTGATVGSLIGLRVDVVSDGTVTNGAIGIDIESDNTVLEQDIKLSNGLAIFASALAITATSTSTTLPAGSIGITSHNTGVGKLFVSDGSVWQYMKVSA